MFCEPSVSTILHMRCLLICFQMVFGLKINLNKTEMIRIGNRREEASLARILGCKVTNLPIKYLGLPFGAKYKDVRTWESIIDIFGSPSTLMLS